MSTTRTDEQSRLLGLIAARDLTAITDFLTKELPNLSLKEQHCYTSHDGSRQVLVAAVRTDAPQMFAVLWDTLYKNNLDPQIPYECLRYAARTGNVELARVFSEREPMVLARTPPTAGQMVTAFRAGEYEYVDFILSQGIRLDHDWPWVRFLRLVVDLEQNDEELLANVRWALERGARVRGAGALRKVASDGVLEVAKLLLAAGAHVDDLEDDSPDDPASTPPVQSALMEAVQNGHLFMVKLLVGYGANFDWENEKGETPRAVMERVGFAAEVQQYEQDFAVKSLACATFS